MARSQDNDSASSQFFIVQSDSTYLDGQYAVLVMFMKAWTLLIKFVKM